MFEDTNEVIRSHTSKIDKHYNGQKKRRQKDNTNPTAKLGSEPRCSGRVYCSYFIVATIGPDALLFDTFRVSFLSSIGFSKSGNPDVLKLFHRHSVWMIRISVLFKVNGIRHYCFIDLILPCFSHK
jgi:hypothetical protein